MFLRSPRSWFVCFVIALSCFEVHGNEFITRFYQPPYQEKYPSPEDLDNLLTQLLNEEEDKFGAMSAIYHLSSSS